MGFYSRLAYGIVKTSWGASKVITQQVNAASLRPSRQARRLGILAPGDAPPAASLAGFQDYRQVLLPRQLRLLSTGDFPLGNAVHPHSLSKSSPIALSWENLRLHCAVIGPSGSGKTSNVIAPWIVSAIVAGSSVVAVDVRGDLISEIVAAKKRLGITTRISTFTWDVDDPTHSTGPWSPLQSISLNDSSATALTAQAILGEIDPNDPQKFFAQRDHAWLRGLISLTTRLYGENVHPSVLYKAIRSQDFLQSMIQAAPDAAFELAGIQFPYESDFLNATQGIANKISWLSDPNLSSILDPKLRAANGTSRNFKFDLLFNQPMLLVVGSRISGGERSAIASALMLNQLRLETMKRFNYGNTRPVFWMLDEAGRYSNRIDLPQMLDLFRGANAPVCVAVQDAQQLSSDANERARILGNCDTFITLRGVSQVTAEYFSKRLGTLKSPVTTTTLNPHQQSPSISYIDTPILGQNEIMNPPVGNYGGVVQLRSKNVRPFLVSFN